MWDTVFLRTMNTLQIVIDPEMLATPTEQYGMAGGSIDALVKGRNPRGQKLDLNVAQVAEFCSKIPHLFRWQIMDCV